MRTKIIGKTKQVIDEKLDSGWSPKRIVDFLREEKGVGITSMAIIKYRRKRTKALELHEGKRALHDFQGPVVAETSCQ